MRQNSQCLVSSKNIIRQEKSRRNISIKTDPEPTQILELADKDMKTVIITTLAVQKVKLEDG